MKGLDEILDSAEQAPAQPEQPIAQPEDAAPADERPRDEHGRFVAKEPGVEGEQPLEQAAPPAEPQTQLPPEDFKALKDERRKRQAIEQRLQQLEDYFARQSAQPRQPAEMPSFWEDPDTVLDQRFQQFGQSLLQQWKQEQHVERANMSEVAARQKYEDYDDVIQDFHRAAAENPRLATQMFNAPDPAEYAYREAKQLRDLSEAGGLEAYKAKLRAEWEAEVKSSLPRPSAPQTTADHRSVGARTGPEWSGPTPLSSIISAGG